MRGVALALVLGLAQQGLAEEQRVAIVIANNEGDSGDEPLDYAEADAVRFRQLLHQLGGVRDDRILQVIGGGAEAVRQAFAQATGRLAELEGRGPTSLLVYVSSHADEEALHLGGTRLPLAELRRMLADVPAGFRFAVIDACRTKVRAKSKGGRPGPEIQVAVERPSQMNGSVLMLSAGEGESAQEWTYLRGSLFTHHLMAGMRGLADVDADGVVTLNEAYTYTFRRTASQSVLSSAGPQRPSFEMQLAGFGDWALARMGMAGASVVLGKGLEGEFWVADQRQELVAEVSKGPSDTMRLALIPGWYRVVHPDGSFAEVADVNLGWGGERILKAEDFTRIPAARARLRGSEPIALRPWRVSLGYALGSPFLAGMSLQHFGEAGLGREWRSAFVRLQGGFTRATWRSATFATTQDEVSARVSAGALFHAWVMTFALGLEARGSAVFQTVVRDDAEQIERLFGVREPPRSGALLGGGAVGWAALPLGERWWLSLEVAGGGVRVPTFEGAAVAPYVQVRAAVAFAF